MNIASRTLRTGGLRGIETSVRHLQRLHMFQATSDFT